MHLGMRLAVATVSASVLLAVPAQAATITVYTSEALWAAAAGLTTLEDFNDITLAPGLTSITGGGTSTPSVNGVTPGRLWDRLDLGSSVVDTTFAFGPAITAFGGTWFPSVAGFGTGIIVDVDFLGGGSQNVGTFGGVDGFWGFVSDMPIIAVHLSENGLGGVAETYELENLQFTSVPEPATLLLLGAGLGAVAARRRLRKRA